ncbi:MAG: F-type H+-transporting ATPase subunit gamma [Frankiaceae bacterium]|jgi:F-type H+-transporting ATPase subunit gamma|nr:F-type H+-transporting ATPase subunit gamma [Frankiaceae bacterium]
MGAKLREYRRRIRSVQSTKKITRAMELIAASRIVKAQQRIEQARPYAEAITGVVGTVASQGGGVEHALTTPRPSPSRAAVLVLASDRGLAGGYSANVLRTAEELNSLVRSEGKEPVPFLVGRKAVGFYRFRGRDISRQWTGFTEQPSYDDAKAVADALIDEFVRGGDDGGVDEIHIVYTQFKSMASQQAVARRMLPMVIEYADDATPEQQAQYEFEPSAEGVLDALLPRYIEARIYAAMLDAAASEQAARRRAMKAATDNADELIKALTRDANSARQAEITQEIMEIVGGAEALAQGRQQ